MESTDKQINDEISLLKMFAPLARHWIFVLAIAALGAAIAFGVTRRLPKTYESAATIFVQENSSVGLLRSLPFSGGTSSSSSGYFVILLQSDSLLRDVQSRLSKPDIRGLTGRDNMRSQDVLLVLKSRVRIRQDKNGAISAVVQAFSPDVAAKVANFMIGSLDKFVVTGSIKKADFISANLKQTDIALRKAEDDMTSFSKQYDIASIADQTRELVTALSEIESKLVDINVQIQDSKSRLASSGDMSSLVDEDVRSKSLEASKAYLLERQATLRAQLKAFPEAAARYTRLERNIAVLNKTYETLTEQYQIARITQKGEDGDYQIIDIARPNPIKVAPRVSVNTLEGFMAGFVLAALAVGVYDHLRDKNRQC